MVANDPSPLGATIVGTGYVGLTYAAGFSENGIPVQCVDLDPTIVAKINHGESPIDEPGLADAIREGRARGLLHATTNLAEVAPQTDAFFVCVGTYCDTEGHIDLTQVRGAARAIGETLPAARPFPVVCVKSTVIPGTSDGIVLPLLETTSHMSGGREFGLCMSPEFLREGNALRDITRPDKIVIGGLDARSTARLRPFFASFTLPSGQAIVETDLRTAELVKYAQNSFLAVKISFINEIANLAERFGVDVGDVARVIGLDARIAPAFLNAGAGFGGSCFPKDVQALVSAARTAGYEPKILVAALETNQAQKRHVLELLEAHGPARDKKVAVLGLAFKPNTGDTREAVAREVIQGLLERGAREITAYDPSEFARHEIETDFGEHRDQVRVASTVAEALTGVDAVLVLTEWDEFRRLAPADILAHAGSDPVIIDGRRIFDPETFHAAGLTKLTVLGQSRDRSFVPGRTGRPPEK